MSNIYVQTNTWYCLTTFGKTWNLANYDNSAALYKNNSCTTPNVSIQFVAPNGLPTNVIAGNLYYLKTNLPYTPTSPNILNYFVSSSKNTGPSLGPKTDIDIGPNVQFNFDTSNSNLLLFGQSFSISFLARSWYVFGKSWYYATRNQSLNPQNYSIIGGSTSSTNSNIIYWMIPGPTLSSPPQIRKKSFYI